MVNLRKEIREKIFTYLTAAFGLVAGLAWNDAVKALIEYLFPLNQDSVLAKLIYAVLVTVILVLVTVYLLKFLRKEETGKK
ncbi:MAG: DUF5654 family protein [Patescibacteria group bacterium]